MTVGDGLRVESWGARFDVCCEDPALVRALGEALPPGSKSTPVPESEARAAHRFVVGRDGVLSLDGAVVTRLPGDRSRIVQPLSAALRDHVAQHAPSVVFVHAGVVGSPAGVIVIPGRSHSGKTTLVQALLRQGASYFSDEFAVVDRDGLIHPFPKPLSVRTVRRPRHGVPVPVSACQTTDAPGRPALILVTRYRSGATWAPEPLSVGAAVLAILDNTVVARSRPRAAMATAVRVAAGASALKGPRGEADEAASRILSMIDQAVELTPD
jgi:hypothetical protein